MKRKGKSLAEMVAEQILQKHEGYFVSRRDGFVILKINNTIVWIRQTPISSRSLQAFVSIIKKHEYDKLVLLRLYNEADYVKKDDLLIFDEIQNKNDFAEVVK